ncbi:tRNA (uridine(54)-C5)-methyltransferase TrmA [Testudinibacter aquarius]|uniref:tRNA/tmRNA (uracil-C(5))-methyltransferase n=1 Tax=Testudinibacter aquarius TaxID=1524974 RepID=A0A4R3YGZ4_9PAST|nr:tRNA (uridine(54)-C5)-methyltransferase TrmA [Testudinibacter aquarius]KAE9529406.1 tRNA (uridine(54)-C5)-methyltransferase TrmA [Testudinibacter aquarius]TCV89843.1 tRNA (uracil-5-)-methyltransferase [Testudinibacter aquarius]TNG92729.1 tRNA (uridine(54)-C5)-methyltransferase TrmA [Testudinibacter aquarius]
MPNQSLAISQYPQLLATKQQKLAELLAPFSAPSLEIFASEPEYYRMRAEFRIWHDQGEMYHIMFDPQTKQRYRVDHFPVASRLINRMMAAIIPLLQSIPLLAHKLFQIDYLSTRSDKIIVSLLYHKKLDEQWQQQAQILRQHLQQQGFDLQLIGRASKQKVCLEQEYIDEVLTINRRDYTYRQVENSFTQPNAGINIKMIEWALSCTADSQGDLLELYCGNGNFSVALAQNFRKVLATEIAKPSVAAAQFNIENNHIDNLQIIRMSAEEFTQAINGVRQFNRLQGIDLHDYQCETILVDPPRAGLDSETVKMVQHYPRILYISCNPHTLCDNLQTLCQSHRIERAALFDQFPYTEHMETGVFLSKNKAV